MRAYVGDLLTAGGTRVVAFCEMVAPLSDDVVPAGPVAGEFTLRGTGATVQVRGRVAATAGLVCGACLRGFSQTLEVDIDEEFARPTGQVEAAGEQALTPQDFIAAISADDVIDLTELVRQHLALALPIAPRCTPDCRGLCPRCGADRNAGGCACDTQEIDPRFDALRRWAEEPAPGGARTARIPDGHRRRGGT